MANGHGGYRRPSNPAPVSGPGALSRRTDGGPSNPVRDLPDAKYGENKAFRAAQQAAPMAASGPDLSGIVPLSAPTQRPDEPLTAGMPFGPGAGSSLNPSGPGNLTPEQAARYRAYLPVLVTLASLPNADAATKRFVRQLRGDLG